MRTWKLTIQYDGTAYAGWQRQDGQVTVQEVLEDSLSDLLGERIVVVGAGRTDAGVHAAGQVVSFCTASGVPAPGLVHGTNAILPKDVAVLRAKEAAPGFDARRDATGKLYRYRIFNQRVRSPLATRFSHRVVSRLDRVAMAGAAAKLTGRHDFSSFRNAGSVSGSAVRELRRLDIFPLGKYLCVEAEGDGFLYKMVRNLVGTLISVGLGKMTAERVEEILLSRDRRLAGPAAPAKGLCLVEVYY